MSAKHVKLVSTDKEKAKSPQTLDYWESCYACETLAMTTFMLSSMDGQWRSWVEIPSLWGETRSRSPKDDDTYMHFDCGSYTDGEMM